MRPLVPQARTRRPSGENLTCSATPPGSQFNRATSMIGGARFAIALAPGSGFTNSGPGRWLLPGLRGGSVVVRSARGGGGGTLPNPYSKTYLRSASENLDKTIRRIAAAPARDEKTISNTRRIRGQSAGSFANKAAPGPS